MIRFKSSLLATAVSLVISQSALADDLLAVYNLAEQNDPQIKSAFADRNAALEARPQALSALQPTVTATGNLRATERDVETDLVDDNERFENYGFSVSLTQPIYHHDQWVGLKIADAQIAQEEAEYSSAEQSLVARTLQAYFNVLSAYENVKFTTVEKEATNRQLEQTKKRFEVGLISVTDVNEAQARYDLAVAQDIQAKNDMQNRGEQLREITNKYHSNLNTLGGSFSLVTPVPANIEEWSNSALSHNPDLKSLEFATQAAREDVNLQRSFHYPTLDFVGNYTYDQSQQDGAGNGVGEPKTKQSFIELQVNVPIFQGGFTSSKSRESGHRFNSAKQLLQQQRRTTISQSRQAYLSVMASIARTGALAQAVKSNKSALEATKSGFEVGTRTIVEVLNAQQEYHRAIRDHAQERYTYILNTVSLKQAAGMLSKSDVQQINSWLSDKVLVSAN
jgi:outer membrane protein